LRKEGCDARIASGGGRMKVTMDRYEVYAGDLELELASQFFSNNFVTLE
jgi:hypothetical protein